MNATDASIKSLGQFIALTKLSRHVCPIVYAWPAGTIFSYWKTSKIAASQKNKDNFLLLLRSLSEVGIQNVHLMSHSMGAQNLLAMFEDKHDSDPPSRSDVSLMFRQDPAFEDDIELQRDGKQLMVCKSIILMNPHFPVEAFVDRGFISIRRVCHNITVLGDTKDFVLKVGSKILDIYYNKIGRQQPHLLRSNKSLESNEFKYLSLGSDIDLLYIPKVHNNRDQEQEPLTIKYSEEKPPIRKSFLFPGGTQILFTPDESVIEKEWLDLDVIDTTSLDTNIKGIRHSGFSMNPIILNDLEELIVGGQRASKRSSLLHREGNIYTYGHAPSFVTL